MATAEVKMVCGACGAGVHPGAAACDSCGVELRFPQGIGSKPPVAKERRGREDRKVRQGGAGREKRETEPWMIIAGVAILVLIGYVVYNAVTAPAPVAPVGAPSAAPSGAPVAPPAMGGGPDLAALEDAVRMRPSDHDALRLLANGYHDAARWEQAVATYGKYLELHPDDPDARVDMGVCYFEMSKSDPTKREAHLARAIGEMTRALKEHPKHQAAAFNLGIVTLSSGDPKGAAGWFQRAAAIDESTPLGQKARAMLEQHSFTN